MNSDNIVNLSYAINKNLQYQVRFENDQFKTIYIFFKNANGDIEASRCEDRELYEFIKYRAIRDYNEKGKGV